MYPTYLVDKSLSLTTVDYETLLDKFQGDVSAIPLRCSLMQLPSGESRYVITDIIGEVRNHKILSSQSYCYCVYVCRNQIWVWKI